MKKYTSSLWSGMLVTALTVLAASANTYQASSTASPRWDDWLTKAYTNPENERMNWFRDAKFGLFVHWGLYAVPAGQWGHKTNYTEWFQAQTQMPVERYGKYAEQFDPTGFNGKSWAQLAKDAGMKYMVITAKHHDGFCMFNSAETDYNIVKATPYQRDPLTELSRACQEAGLKLGFFYSLPDWHYPEMPAAYNQRGFHGNPNPKADFSKYLEYMRNQVRELLTGYGPVGMMWFDGGAAFRSPERSQLIEADKMINLIRELQPDCLINNRLGAHGDYRTYERLIPVAAVTDAPFEICMPLNDHWGYNKFDQNWKPAGYMIRFLTDVASKGGNLLLNVGATAEGTFPEPAVKILREIGNWLGPNGDAIYGTSWNPWLTNQYWGAITAKADKLFLHVFESPTNHVIRLKGLKTEPKSIEFLAYPNESKSLSMNREAGGDLIVRVPERLPNPHNSVIVMQFAAKPEVALSEPSIDLSEKLRQ